MFRNYTSTISLSLSLCVRALVLLHPDGWVERVELSIMDVHRSNIASKGMSSIGFFVREGHSALVPLCNVLSLNRLVLKKVCK